MDAHQKRILALAICASDQVMKTVFQQIDSDSDDEDYSNELCLWRQRKRLRGEVVKPARIEGYIEATIPNMKTTAFRQHFRMLPETFEEMERVVAPLLAKRVPDGRPVIEPRRQLLGSLWLLATPDSFRSVADRFNMGKSSLSNSFMRVVQILCDVSGQYISWPATEESFTRIKAAFSKIKGLDNVIGAIDGSDIEVKAPKEDSQYYINRKKRYAVTLQAVCDADLRFTDCFAGYAGSTGDLRILRNSDLYKAVIESPRVYFPQQEFIIGDKIYPVLTWLIPSFKDNGTLTEPQKNFNYVHASTRQVIERAFALLKGRFRRLKFLDMNRTDMIASVIIACCVLHNICLCSVVEGNNADFIAEGVDHVNLLRNNLNLRLGENDHNDGVAKRNYLVTLV